MSEVTTQYIYKSTEPQKGYNLFSEIILGRFFRGKYGIFLTQEGKLAKPDAKRYCRNDFFQFGFRYLSQFFLEAFKRK